MVLALLEEVHAQDPDASLYVCTPRNVALYQAFKEAYPYVTILNIGRSSALSSLIPLMGAKNICITPPTPGRIPLLTKFVARCMGIRGGLVGFDDGSSINRILYTHTVPHDTSKLYCNLLVDLLPLLGLTYRRFTPVFHAIPVDGVLSRFGLTQKGYVVVHPMGSSLTRSIVGAELERLVHEIQVSAPNLQVVLSGSTDDVLRFNLKEGRGIVFATGLLPQEIATLVQGSALYIGVDTGITHLASALGVRSLVLAHNGTPHWLPYYNSLATVIYKIRNDVTGVHEGRAHLEACREGRTHYLDRIPEAVIFNAVREALTARVPLA